MYSYDVEDKTISMSSMAYPTSHLSLWECRLEGNHEDFELGLDSKKEVDKDDKIVVRSVTKDVEVELNESRLLNLPFHLLEMIMHHCIGVEYMPFRATCKSCHLAAPLIQWNKKTSLRKYSSVSPWLMVVEKNRGIITFKDPVFGDKYFMKRSNRHSSIRCSRFGWLLCGENSTLVFFNPFTNDSRKLPYVDASEGFDSLCFSAPLTSNNCKVVGFKARGNDANVYIYSKQTWRVIGLDFRGDTPPRFRFSIFCKGDVYALCDKGEVYSFKNLFKPQVCNFKKGKGVDARHRNRGGKYYLKEHDQQLLLVMVGESGKYVEVLKLNYNSNE
ncbi:F-box protein At4g00893-like [Bidens hawaiensis]|uniref:F-box protein At4g00893-like n=1 Tax=Bidens hawaiensis TaxID=980011 RepID=UPI004049DB65